MNANRKTRKRGSGMLNRSTFHAVALPAGEQSWKLSLENCGPEKLCDLSDGGERQVRDFHVYLCELRTKLGNEMWNPGDLVILI